jgi:hypothetical protein
VSVDAHPKDTVALGAARLAASTERGTTREAAAAAPAPVATSPEQSAPTTPTPPARPTVAAPPPQPAAAAAPAAAATAQGATAPPRRTTPQQLAASPAGAQPKRSRKGALIAGSAIVAAAVGVGAFVLLGGDDGGDAAPDVTGQVVQTAGQPSDGGGSAAQPSGRECTAPTGRCVFITDIARDGDNMVVHYETVGYEPHQNAGADSHHVHFYFDTVPVTQAGMPADSGNWVAWGLEEGGGEYVYTFPVTDIPAGASQLRASVANVDHALEDLNFDGVRLPSA